MRYIDKYEPSAKIPLGIMCTGCFSRVNPGEPVFYHFAVFQKIDDDIGEHVLTHRDCMMKMMVQGDSHINSRISLLQDRIDAILVDEEGEGVSARWLIRRLLEPHVILSRSEMLDSVKGIMKKVGKDG